MTCIQLWLVFIALFCPCSLRSFPMLYVAFARRVKRPTREASQRLSFTAPNAITAVTRRAWTWVRSWCASSRRTAGSAWSARRAPCASSHTTRTKWCFATSVTEDTTRSAWAWTPYRWVSGYASYVRKTPPHRRRREELKHPRSPNDEESGETAFWSPVLSVTQCKGASAGGFS